MAKYRFGRLGEEFKKEISTIIKDEVKDPRVGFVSVVDVQVSSDLRHAKVFVSVLGNETEVKETMAALNKATGFIRREVAQRIQLRYTPEIVFVYDDSIIHGARISKLLNECLTEGEKDE
ncbi:MAG: 30S ribosome-binding factor RbfA [Desulfitobacteriaceae bacterium]|nr:30S ribosome-binding factor RbfA [Desulfitobacteriaceae bacterium]MDD4751774.1 30S ribosome-binding factor RbfA [Desulfitobacteriaceae bacterium]